MFIKDVLNMAKIWIYRRITERPEPPKAQPKGK
jgi:hypothetical protein